jgi:hypothetical protein
MIAREKSKVWQDTKANAIARGATTEQAERLADATLSGWRKR